MLNRVGNLRHFAEASRLPILARRRSIKNSVSVCGEQILAYAKVPKETYHHHQGAPPGCSKYTENKSRQVSTLPTFEDQH